MIARALAYALLVSSVAACGGLASTPSVAAHAPAQHHRGWIDGGVGQQDLLYVSNGDGEVTVYRYWQRTLVGVLTGFTQPMGECVDAKQNVYITDYAAQRILEFAHGGSKPVATFNDAPDSPYACAIDPTTGNLAAANDDGTSAQGNVATWSAGKRTTYTDPALYNFQGCAYDDSGNLLVTNGAVYYTQSTQFAWLPKNGTRLITIKVPSPYPSYGWGDVLGIQWDGKYFVIDGDEWVYRESLIHGQAYYVGSTQAYAQDWYNDGPYAIYDNTPGSQGTQIVEGMRGITGGSQVAIWHYPAGGQPLATIDHAIDEPVGVAISLKTKK